MSEVKQVIVMRKDLKMRRGKEIAQGAHASIKWLSDRLRQIKGNRDATVYEVDLSFEEERWMEGAFTKITLQVDSEKELLEVYQSARDRGLTVSLITDAGKTEFDGVPTQTCIAIGPHEAERIDAVTGHLKLY